MLYYFFLLFNCRYMFPRKLLTYHFWSLQQRSEFALMDLKRRLISYRPVLRCMQARLRTIKVRQSIMWVYLQKHSY